MTRDTIGVVLNHRKFVLNLIGLMCGPNVMTINQMTISDCHNNGSLLTTTYPDF